MYNWSHEHDVQKVMRERHGGDKYGLNAVLGWCDLSHEVSTMHIFFFTLNLVPNNLLIASTFVVIIPVVSLMFCL